MLVQISLNSVHFSSVELNLIHLSPAKFTLAEFSPAHSVPGKCCCVCSVLQTSQFYQFSPDKYNKCSKWSCSLGVKIVKASLLESLLKVLQKPEGPGRVDIRRSSKLVPHLLVAKLWEHKTFTLDFNLVRLECCSIVSDSQIVSYNHSITKKQQKLQSKCVLALNRFLWCKWQGLSWPDSAIWPFN